MNEMIYDKGLSTMISWQNKDHYGHTIPAKTQAKMYRLRKWHQRTRMKRGAEYNVHQALQYIIQTSSKMGLPRSVRENAAVIYRKAARNDLIRGRSIEGMAATALYAGCRQCNFPRSLDEISKSSGISKKEIGRNYRFISRNLSLKILPIKPQDFLNRFTSKLKLTQQSLQKANELIEKGHETNTITGCSPSGIAAAAIYIASILCDERKTQKEVAETAGVTEVTIRNRYREFCDKLNINIAV
jgi:transcription initiation factor TFIIB